MGEKVQSPLFQVHMLNDVGKEKALKIALAFDNLLSTLAPLCNADPSIPSNREFSIVKTKLEEASFFAKKAMANNPENCQ